MNELIKQARELCEKATQGPWKSLHGIPNPSVCQDQYWDKEIAVVNGSKDYGGWRYRQAIADADLMAASRILVPRLCDALEAAQKENEELKNILRFNMVQIHGERMTVLDALSSLTARAEKAEAKIKSIHESLNFADKSRSKCANYVELAVSNGLAIGRIAVAIQHDYDAELPKGE